MGIQVLKGDELGDASGRAWTELGDIDAYGHAHGWGAEHRLTAELRALERRITGLLEHGWQHVVVVTDHGWLQLRGRLPKASDPTPSLVKDGKDLGVDGMAALFVEDEDHEGPGAVVVVVGADGAPQA